VGGWAVGWMDWRVDGKERTTHDGYAS
jgi:hypothetical protein